MPSCSSRHAAVLLIDRDNCVAVVSRLLLRLSLLGTRLHNRAKQIRRPCRCWLLHLRVVGCKFNSRKQSCRYVCFLGPAIAQKLFGQHVVRISWSLLFARSCTLAVSPRATASTLAAALVHNVAVQRKLRGRLSRSRGRSRSASIPVNVTKLQFPRSLLAAGVA